MSFGERLQALRIKAGLSQSALAKKAGLSVRNVQNWETGHRTPRADVLFKLADGLGVSCEAFKGCVGKDEPAAKPKPAPAAKRPSKRKK